MNAKTGGSGLEGLIDELARVVWDAEQARTLVRRAGFPPANMPAFSTAQVFWARVMEDAANGMLLGGVRALVDEACWTRLLSMKRPDLFLCVNSANKNRVRQIFDAVLDSARTYLTFTRRILAFPWASATTPGDAAEREIWEGRVALLDAILYEPS